ncbi:MULTISPECIES: restriction endonuclease subunit S [Methanobrevibacter]|uniref:Type I restriction enzyme S subunit n=2 Tax=Methanobrevibacter gottschalkii TaxID=190974 RepID=A0A3N5B3I5_9EURY|nr:MULTISPECIES: restriction endonuclease subunit S [Methanobrevibacter]OEC94269.1 hypothetical protein A9505_08910 [Methanobrevibacter sp. A27]RPF51857.1 type I restriction enzyme S subunit [Methanobrevibacter gottschalkii DSM 11977]
MEFTDNWQTYKLGDILTFYSTNSFSREKLNYEFGNVKNIHYGDIHTKYPTIVSLQNNKDVPFINEDIDLSKFNEDQYLQDGDLIIVDASEDYDDIGKAIEVMNVNDEKFLAGLHTILARDEKNITVNGFKADLFSTNTLKTKIKVIANGISVLGISKKNISKLEVKIPSKREQQEIVSFINTIDRKIELLEEKHQYYQDFKKYLMQQIFTQNLRFDFDKEWENIRLKDFLKSSSSSLSLNDLEENHGEYGLYGATGIVKLINFYEKTEPYLSIVKDGAGVGRIFLCEPNTSIVGTMQYLTPKEGVDLEFSYYLLNTIEFRKYVVGSTIPHIYFKDYSKEKLLVPQIEEQQEIASILSNIDNKLNLIQDRINHMGQFKKGLLQQMFV